MNTKAMRIPHLTHPTLGIRMPVKLDFSSKEPKPLYKDGKLVYALPGGRSYVA